VPVGTDTFVRNFVDKTGGNIIDDIEKLDVIQDGFVHYQLVRFCQTTRLQYINSHIMFNNLYYYITLRGLTWGVFPGTSEVVVVK
jgi:hypothetical protein